MRTRFRQSLVFAVLLSLVGATTASAAVAGDPLRLGVTNTIAAATKLTGSYAGALFSVVNTSAHTAARAAILQTASTTAGALYVRNTGGGPAANFVVNAGKAPFTVNSGAKVTNLNADKVDGYGGEQLVGPLAYGRIAGWASYSEPYIETASPNVASVRRIATGYYCITFSSPLPASRLASAVATTVYGSNYPDAKISTYCGAGELGVVLISNANSGTNGDFNFIVP